MSKILRKIMYVYKVISEFKNWLTFLLDHAHLIRGYPQYRLRNGLKINLLRSDKCDWSTDMLMDIFIRKDYGNIPDNITIVDIGANIGAFALYSTFKKNNRCFAFEPEKNNYDKLVENIEVNGLKDKVKTFNFAVSGDCLDKKLFKFESIAHSLSRESDKFDIVHSTDLNSIINNNELESIGYLKIDCEGSEFDILYNTNDGVFKKVRLICVEYHNYSDKQDFAGDSLIKYIENKSFRIIEHKLVQDGLLGIVKAENKIFNRDIAIEVL